MKKIINAIIILILMSFSMNNSKNIYSFKCKSLDGSIFDFSLHKGKKIMIVNTASQCGYTSQYKDLEKLYNDFKNKNFLIVAFPCNDFGGQEPGTAIEIKQFCSKNYGVSFPIMEKISVNGAGINPIYKWLTSKSENGVEDSKVSWNFNKYLINEKGQYVKHLASAVSPLDKEIISWINAK